MGKNRYDAFLTKLVQDTKSGTIKWKYLDQNTSLCEGMNWMEHRSVADVFSGVPQDVYFNNEDSFYTSIDETYIVIFVEENEPATVYVIPKTFKKIVTLCAEQYGELITRLLNLVQAQFPNAEAFIDDFLQSEEQQ